MHKATQNRFLDQETQVGMAGPYTAKTIRRHSQASPRVESPRQMGQGETRNSWRRTVLEEAQGVNKTWSEIKTDDKN